MLEGEWDGVGDTLAAVEVIVALGDAAGSDLRFDRLLFENDCGDDYLREDGLLLLDGLCPDPENRLFVRTDSLVLRPLAPDPIRSVSRITWRLIEEGRMRLTVVDARGGVVRVIDEGDRSSGEYSAELRRTDLPGGTYYLRLQTPTQDLLRPFVVQ